jgi:hypothetical protein
MVVKQARPLCVQARKLTANRIIDEEALMGLQSGKTATSKEDFPAFLQVLQPKKTKEQVWAGLRCLHNIFKPTFCILT